MLYIIYPSWLTPEIVPGFWIRWYGLMYLCAFASCYLVTMALLSEKMRALKPVLFNFFTWTIFGVILGARIISELVYSQNLGALIRPWEFFWPFDSYGSFVGISGMSYHGGLLGGTVAALVYTKIKKLPMLKIADYFMPGLAFGYTFGRIGNFANSELFGRITSSPFGMLFANAERLPYGDERVKEVADAVGIAPDSTGLVNLPRHPSQLYEALFEGIITGGILLALFFLFRRRSALYRHGLLFYSYIFFYGLFRFFIEYFRQPDPQFGAFRLFSDESSPIWYMGSWLHFTVGQFFCLAMMLSAVVGYVIIYRKNPPVSLE